MRAQTWTMVGGVVLAGVLAWACSSEEEETTTPTGTAMGTGGGTGTATSSGGSTSSGGTGGATTTSSQGGSGGSGETVVQESEPNGLSTETEYDDLSLDVVMEAAIGTAGDEDVFRLPTTGFTAYEAELTPTAGSPLVPHLTVFDDGRGGDPAADDYVKIVRAASGAVRIQWMAMGAGGYFLAVRDARNVDGQSLGDATHTYRLTVTELATAAVTVGPLPVSAAHSGTLAFPGAIDLFTFAATAWDDAVVDMQAADDLDGRLYVVAEATADWIARNDDRSQTDVDPLIDAPLSEGGNLILVVESIAETPTNLGYTMTASVQ